jgi:3-hydroxy-3-methylglutaryl CoA synthase
MAGRAHKDGGPERSVAWNDEDAVTMAVSAAVNCLRGFDRSSVDAVWFASTTYAFQEKQAAALIAKALDLRRDVRTTDVSGSLRAGTDGLHAAFDAVAAGSAKRVLVVASDARLGAPGSALEQSFGDGAAAFLIGGSNAIASFEGAFAIADEIVDVWRSEGDPFVHSWEERFVVQQGYAPGITEVVRGLLAKLPASAGDFSRIALFGPDARSLQGAAAALQLDRAKLVDPLFGKLGNAGVAFAPLLLCSALESAQQGERVLLAAYGDGGEAMAFAVTDQIGKLEPRRARPGREGVRRGARRGPLGDDPHPRARGGRRVQGPEVQPLRRRAVPAPARLRALLREGRLRAGAPLGPDRHRADLHLRLLLPDPRPTDRRDRHRDRRRARAPAARERAARAGAPRAAGRVRVPPHPRGGRAAELLLEGRSPSGGPVR